MSSEKLTQAEIDRLLNHTGEATVAGTAELTEPEKVAIGEVNRLAFGAGAAAWTLRLGQAVEIGVLQVDLTRREDLAQAYPTPCLAVLTRFTQGLAGLSLLLLPESDARGLADILPGRAAEPEAFAPGVLSEAMGELLGAAATALSDILKVPVGMAPPSLSVVSLADTLPPEIIPAGEPLLRLILRLSIGSLLESEMVYLLPLPAGKALVAALMRAHGSGTTPVRAAAPEREAESVVVQPAVFLPLKPSRGAGADGNLHLLLDVSLALTVELGRTQKPIRDILALGVGSVVELDKLAGEPVEVLVNGKLIAKGEVVVIDESFGVRITEIVSVMERVSNL